MKPDINTALGIFYFASAVFMLVVAIIAYPTLRDREKKK